MQRYEAFEKRMNIAGKFHKVSENPLVIGFIGNVNAEDLNAETIEYIKTFYDVRGKNHHMTKDFKVKINQSLYNSFMVIDESHFEFEYRLLSRCKQDCEYYLGYGGRCDKYLWAGNPRDHIAKMRELYNIVPEKPEWLTEEQINEYAERMGV